MLEIKDLILSVGIVAYNEGNGLWKLLSDIENQTYEKQLTELLFIDSMSIDDTYDIFCQFRKKHISEYKDIKILKNTAKIQAGGWNVAIENFSGDALVRVDAHAKLTPDFLKNNVNCLKSGEYVCGGKRPNISVNNSGEEMLVFLGDTSLFGGSFANYHSSEKKQYTESVFHGCYRREVIEKVGKFNEKLGRTEDNDFNYRVREAGYKICYDPEILSYQFSRDSISGSIKQKFGNGYWVAKTLFINPKCISLFHFVPLCFVIVIAAAVIMALFGFFLPLVFLAAAYLSVDMVISLFAIIKTKPFKPIYLCLPLLLLALHISYGIGSVVGLFSFFK